MKLPDMPSTNAFAGRVRILPVIASIAMGLLIVTLFGCAGHPAQSPDERIRQQAAQSAQQLHHDLKDAGKEAKQAFRQAGRTTRDVVSGARQGWAEGGSKHAATSPNMDINHASVAELDTLPGITSATARRIAAHRPYASPKDLRKQGIVTPSEYKRIADSISVE